MQNTAVIVSFARTPTGKFGRSLAGVDAPRLGAMALKEAVARSGLPAGSIDEVMIGTHFQAGIKANSARQAAIYAGLPDTVPAFTPNKNCATALKAITLAGASIMLGDNDIVAAGGCECMSRIPYLLSDARFGYRMGPGELRDGMLYDGLVDPFCHYHMGITAENVAEKYGVSRERQDEFALRSHNLAEKAWNGGRYDDDIVAVELCEKSGARIFNRDETYRENARYEDFAKLKPVFRENGTVTVGNASPLNDAAAIVVMTSEKTALDRGLAPVVKYIAGAAAATDPAYMGYAPVYAVGKLLKRTGFSIGDIGLWEINEAFAAQAVACVDELRMDMNRVNVNGGSVALGHPVGATGARLVITLMNEMRRRGEKYGVVTLCIGGGQALAALFELCE